MAESNYRRLQAFVAGADLTDRQNHFVTLNSDGEAVLPGANAAAIGVNLENSPEDDYVGVMCESGSKVAVVAGAAIAAGAPVASNASGRAVTAAGVTTQVLGVAVESADSDGDLITVLFQPRGFFAQS